MLKLLLGFLLLRLWVVNSIDTWWFLMVIHGCWWLLTIIIDDPQLTIRWPSINHLLPRNQPWLTLISHYSPLLIIINYTSAMINHKSAMINPYWPLIGHLLTILPCFLACAPGEPSWHHGTRLCPPGTSGGITQQLQSLQAEAIVGQLKRHGEDLESSPQGARRGARLSSSHTMAEMDDMVMAACLEPHQY